MVRFFDPRFDPEPDDPRDLRSRTDERRERKTSETKLFELAQTLVGLSERSLAKLELDEALLDAVHDARLITSPAARNRALRVVRATLRNLDAEAIAKRLERGTAPAPRPASVALEDWCQRLLAGGDPALAEFVASYATADRQQLRNLTRNAVRAAEGARAEHVAALRKVLARYVR
jgi:ribosome-associated protein